MSLAIQQQIVRGFTGYKKPAKKDICQINISQHVSNIYNMMHAASKKQVNVCESTK